MTTAVLVNVAHPVRGMLRVERLPEAFLVLAAAAALGIGGTLIAMPDAYRLSPTLHETFRSTPPWAWGLLLVIPAVAVTVAAVLRRPAAIWPCLILAGVWTWWGLATIPAVASGRGVVAGAIAWAVIGGFTGLSGILARVWDSRPRP